MNPKPADTAAPIADDAKLVELSAEPERPLFPILNQASLMQALVILSAIVPGIYALQFFQISETDARWVLNCFDQLHSVDDVGTDRGSSDPAESRRIWEPPLASWLTALTMKILTPRWLYSVVLISYCSVVGVVSVSYLLGRTLVDARFGFLIVLVLSCHGSILRLALSPVSNALALVFALTAFLGAARYMARANGPLSVDLLITGVGLALCVLAGGPLAIVAILVVLFGLVWPRSESMDLGTGPVFNPRKRRGGWMSAICRIGMGLITLCILGWWPLWMAHRHGMAFWPAWLTGSHGGGFTNSAETGNPMTFESVGHWLSQTIQSLGFLSGLVLLGLWLARRELLDAARRLKLFSRVDWRNAVDHEQTLGTLRNERVKSPRLYTLQFLIVWIVSASLMWVLRGLSNSANRQDSNLYLMFLAMPLLFLAAFALDEIVNRRAGVLEVAGATLFSIFIVWNRTTLIPAEESSASHVIWVLVAGLVAVTVVAWSLQRFTRHRELAQQVILKLCIAFLVLANSLAGLNSVATADGVDADFQRLRRRLGRIPAVSHCTLISEHDPPVRLVFALRSLWPATTLQIVHKWEHLASGGTAVHNTAAYTGRQQTSIRSPSAASAQILVVWGFDSIPLASADGARLPFTPILSPYDVEHKTLSVYKLSPPTNE